MMSNEEIDYRLAAEQLRSGKPLFGVRQLNCVKVGGNRLKKGGFFHKKTRLS